MFRKIDEQALELAKDLSGRSVIKIKVGAVIYDKNGILFWGWNNPGNGFGDHAEHMAVRRYLRSYRTGTHSALCVAVYSSRKGRTITSKPCKNCQEILKLAGVKEMSYWLKLTDNKDFYLVGMREELHGRV